MKKTFEKPIAEIVRFDTNADIITCSGEICHPTHPEHQVHPVHPEHPEHPVHPPKPPHHF